MSYKITWEEKGVYLFFSEALTNDDLIRCTKELHADPRFSNFEYTINDFNAVESFPIDSTAIQLVAEMDAIQYKINPILKTAVVANRLVITGLTNMYKKYFELVSNDAIWETEIFETIEEARKWINS